ncbi:MAG: hypothetical protein AMS24_04185 [Chlamydiae bacterium SM23_39]|nr:MAG: hypothetical protein AMS24_04185 [Chlamydiae bacterium SM23_39]
MSIDLTGLNKNFEIQSFFEETKKNILEKKIPKIKEKGPVLLKEHKITYITQAFVDIIKKELEKRTKDKFPNDSTLIEIIIKKNDYTNIYENIISHLSDL